MNDQERAEQFVVILTAQESDAPSSVFGPYEDERYARMLNEALWSCGLPNSIFRCHHTEPDERVFVGSRVVYDPPQQGASR